jgi:hypothetical protein
LNESGNFQMARGAVLRNHHLPGALPSHVGAEPSATFSYHRASTAMPMAMMWEADLTDEFLLLQKRPALPLLVSG